MNLIDRFQFWRAERQVRAAICCEHTAAVRSSGVAAADLEGQIELQRLAHEIADEAARCEIECNTAVERLGFRDWYDTTRSDAGGDPVYFEGIERALRYLDLRRLVIRHPVQKHLVRFER